MTKKTIYTLLKSDEITIKDIARVFQSALLDQSKTIIIVFVSFIMIAFLDYRLSPVEYQSEATVLLESGSGNGGNASALAGLLSGAPATSSGGEAFGPAMYPKIVSSQAFLNALAVIKIPANPYTKDSITLEGYFAKGAPLSSFQKVLNLPSTIASLFSRSVLEPVTKVLPLPNIVDTTLTVQNQISANMFFSNKVPPIVQLEGQRNNVITILRPRIKVKVVDGEVAVSVKMPDSFLAAAVNKILLEQLINYVTAYKTMKQRTSIDFLQRRFAESKGAYMAEQQRLAGLKDNSLGVIFQSVQTRQQVLENELTIAFNVYNQFAVQLEAAKIELKKETPLFRVLEPISLPSPQVEPSFSSTIIKYILFAIVLSFLMVGYRLLIPKKIS
jgi:uncharacterized protein involved in exopolysaccharide biosynthesis